MNTCHRCTELQGSTGQSSRQAERQVAPNHTPTHKTNEKRRTNPTCQPCVCPSIKVLDWLWELHYRVLNPALHSWSFSSSARTVALDFSSHAGAPWALKQQANAASLRQSEVKRSNTLTCRSSENSKIQKAYKSTLPLLPHPFFGPSLRPEAPLENIAPTFSWPNFICVVRTSRLPIW